MSGSFNRIIRSGNFATDCEKFWSKSFARLGTIDLSRRRFLAEKPLMSRLRLAPKAAVSNTDSA